MPEDRISKLSQRFRTHAVGRRPSSPRNRERHSFYLDVDLVQHLDKSYRDLNHELYPQVSLKKGDFLEALIEYGLGHLPEIKKALSESREMGDGSAKS
jgi:hypothetical protein